MSNLLNVFGRLPEEHQKEAILERLQLMLAKGEWSSVEEVLAEIMQIAGHESFKAHACAMGIKCAIRLREYDKAIQRYEMLSTCEEVPGIISLKAESIYQLAMRMPPERASKIFTLWEELLASDMPEGLQRSLGETGMLLAKAFQKNRDGEHASLVKTSMWENLHPSLVNELLR